MHTLARTHTHTHMQTEDVYMHAQMHVRTHTAQSTPVLVEIQAVPSVLMVGRKEPERQVDVLH